MFRPKRTRIAACLVLAVVATALGCTEKLVAPPPPPVDYAVPDSIQQVFAENCAFSSCHAGTGPRAGLALDDARTSWLSLVGVASTEDGTFQRVAPGDSANSYLVMKLRNDPRITGFPMPFGAYPMDGPLVERIAVWVAQGAPGTPYEGPIAVDQP